MQTMSRPVCLTLGVTLMIEISYLYLYPPPLMEMLLKVISNHVIAL